MSRQDQDRGQDQLPLPSPRSPAELDQRILAHARDNAPVKTRSSALGWTGGAATAAALVLAVFLTRTADIDRAVPPRALEETPAATEALSEALRQRAGAEPAGGAAAPVESSARKALADFDAVREQTGTAPAAESPAALATGIVAKNDESAALESLRDALQRLRQLLDEGDTDSARQGYADLRKACGECGLPETLEQALEQLER